MTFGIKDLCERYGVGEHTVLGWIRTGELKAIDVSRHRSGRPHWRVTVEARSAFEQARTPSPPLPKTRRKKRSAENVIEFFK